MNLKNKILIKSLELFETYGIKQVTMDDISEAMGISKKTLYIHFAGKEELVNNVIQFLFELHFKAIHKIIGDTNSTIQKIEKIYEYALNYLMKVTPVFHFDLKKYYSDSYKIYDQNRRKIIFGIIKDFLDEGQLRGTINKSIHTELFCEFHLMSLDKIITYNALPTDYSARDILDNSIGVSLKGIFNQAQKKK
ncbi:TetR/AcrR family transcriptional regulator [Aquaticitalea lipolytica]|uniref:TetR/AcrR family transcriptional regulator n=1 Tax=Aquaticitalea lipolytica TaxID=1247562 RepID=UPI0024BA4A03|nr:TetR/AcrR family transcriptional regulator [Aquaticitalea lipolytica]